MKELLKEWRLYVEGGNFYHDPKTGHFSKREPGAVKSLTKDGARRAGVDKSYVERGVVTGNDKIQAKMGQNFKKTSCGRLTIDGEPISPKYKCGDYKEPYAEGIDDFKGLMEVDSISVDAVVDALEEASGVIGEQGADSCAARKGEWLKAALKSLNAYALAMKGDLYDEKNETQDLKKHYGGSPIKDDKERKTDKRKMGDRRRKLRSMVGMTVTPFSKEEKSLLTPNSLFETEAPSSNPYKGTGKKTDPGTY